MVSKTEAKIEKTSVGDKQYQVLNGTYYHSETPAALIVLLEKHRTCGDTVRLHYGDADGRDWLEENDVRGTLGRSMGPCKVPILIEQGKRGGPQLIDDRIVRLRVCLNDHIVRVRVCLTGREKEVYRHPAYNIPAVSLIPATELGYTVAAKVNGQIHARFKTVAEAGLYIAEMGFERIANDE